MSKEIQNKYVGDIVDSVLKYGFGPFRMERNRLIKNMQSVYHVFPIIDAEGDDMLRMAGDYSHKKEIESPDIHPKTASFHGFIAGYTDATLRTKELEDRVKELEGELHKAQAPDLSVYPKLNDKLIGELLNMMERVEYMVHSDMHEDINEYLLKPLYHVLRTNGVNLEEQDY